MLFIQTTQKKGDGMKGERDKNGEAAASRVGSTLSRPDFSDNDPEPSLLMHPTLQLPSKPNHCIGSGLNI